jgi:hypothetical protein
VPSAARRPPAIPAPTIIRIAGPGIATINAVAKVKVRIVAISKPTVLLAGAGGSLSLIEI